MSTTVIRHEPAMLHKPASDAAQLVQTDLRTACFDRSSLA